MGRIGLPYELIEFPDNLWFRTVRLPLANQCLSHTLKPEHACKKLLGNFKKPEEADCLYGRIPIHGIIF